MGARRDARLRLPLKASVLEMSAISTLIERWSSWYPKVPPVGFLLREAYADRWMRIHSLPDLRRHPISRLDQEELLRRHNTVAGDLLGENQACALLLCGEPAAQSTTELAARIGVPDRDMHDLGLLPSWLWEDACGFFTGPVGLFGAVVTWRRGAFDSFIGAAANDEIRGLALGNATGQVYAPYDGGADLFFPAVANRTEATRRYAAWLSTRPDGL